MDKQSKSSLLRKNMNKIFHLICISLFSISCAQASDKPSAISWDEGNHTFILERHQEELYRAIKDSEVEKAKELFLANPQAHITEPWLHVACHFGQKEIAEFLLQQGLSANEKITTHIDSFFHTINQPMHFALEAKNLEVIKLLVQNGAHLENLSMKIAQTENTDIMKYLLMKAGAQAIPQQSMASEWATTTVGVQTFTALKEKNKEEIKQTPQNFLESKTIFARHKIIALSSKIRTKEEPYYSGCETFFKTIVFGSPFFKNQKIARFALTRNFKDCNDKTVWEQLLESKDLLMQNPHFMPQLIRASGYINVSNGIDLLLLPTKKGLPKGHDAFLQLVSTRKMAERLYKKEKNPEAKKFVRDLVNTTCVAFHFFNNDFELPSDCALEIISFCDGDFGGKILPEENENQPTTKISTGKFSKQKFGKNKRKKRKIGN